MGSVPLISVYCQVYNTPKEYLIRCIKSVLEQTYRNIEFYILDNGCTDDSAVTIKRYAQTDPRIFFQSDTVNRSGWREIEFMPFFKGKYYAHIDADDWWDPDYLERLLSFAEIQALDMACTGCVFHDMRARTQSNRCLADQVVLTRSQYPDTFPLYHAFLRTIWGKLIRMDTLRRSNFKACLEAQLVYGTDTLISFALLRSSQRIGIDASACYHYRIHFKSKSYQYTPQRFASDVYLYNDAIDFLTAFGPVSARNRNFLQAVYSNAVSDTTGVIQNAALSPADKLREYHTIASHPITLATYRECTDESAERSRANLLVRALEAGAALGKQDDSDLRAAMQLLLPRCGQAVSAANAGLFLEDRQLLQMLLRDDADAVLNILLERLRSNQGVKKYALPETVQALAADDPLLCRINDAVFLRKYGKLYEKVWKGERLDALDGMAGLLMDGKVSGGRETFLELFISLAAMENQIPAFIIGKMQLADLYFRQNRREECRSIILDLTEMGVENDELSSLRQELEAQ